MPRIAALYRYPVKGFTPEPRESLTVQPDGRIAGDRVLAFRFADAREPEDRDGLDYWPKSKGLSLQDFPALAALRLAYDETAQRVLVRLGDRTLVDTALDTQGRLDFTEAISDYVLASPEGARLRRPGRLPLVLVGDGARSRFQDRPRGYVSIHGRASAEELAAALGAEAAESGAPAPRIDDRRFRSNVVFEGADARAELAWNREIRLGGVRFAPEGPIVRCLATHANPDTGARDARVLTGLTQRLGMPEPALGRLLVLAGDGGEIRRGDELEADARPRGAGGA